MFCLRSFVYGEMIAWIMLSTEVSAIVFPEKGSACDKALAAAIYALIPLVTIVVVLGMAALLLLTLTGRLTLTFWDWRSCHMSTGILDTKKAVLGMDSSFVRCCDHQCCQHCLTVDFFWSQKTCNGDHHCGSLFFYAFILYQIGSLVKFWLDLQIRNKSHVIIHKHLYSCQCGYKSNDDRIGTMNIQVLGTMWISGDNNPRYERITTASE